MFGHNITTCQFCGKQYVTGDCIRRDCEHGVFRDRCPGYRRYIEDQAAIDKIRTGITSNEEQ